MRPLGTALVTVAAALAACSDGGEGRSPFDAPPVVQGVSIAPPGPGTLDDLTVAWTGGDPEGRPLSVSYAWKRNGVGIPGQAGATLPAGETTKGDVITAVVSVDDGAGAVSAEASVTIRDTPPTASLPPLRLVSAGGEFGIRVVASDPDGDPVTFAVAYGPAGMTVSAAGDVRWTASLPMFGPSLDVRYGIAVGGIDAPVEGALRVEDPARRYPLRRGGFDPPLRHAGLRAADLDGDGDAELLVVSEDALYEVRPGASGYEIAWMHPFLSTWEDGVYSAAWCDRDGDGDREIVLSAGAGFEVLDGATRRQETSRPFAPCRELEAADLTGDGDLELVCLGMVGAFSPDPAEMISVLDAATWQAEWISDHLPPRSSIALGDVDGDGTLEIVWGGGTVHDGGTFALEWQLEGGFGASVDAGDLDGDGVEEIVAAGDGGTFRGFDAVAKTQRFAQDGFDQDAVLAADLDGDGVDELVLGEGQWGDVVGYALDASSSTLVERFRLDKQGWGVTGLAAGDLDGDGAAELAWGTRGPPTTSATIAVAGPGTAWGVEWITPPHLDGPFAFGGRARLGGGVERLLFAAGITDAGYGPGRFVTLDPATGAIAAAGDAGSELLWDAGIAAADVDGDGVDEAVGISAPPLGDEHLFAVDLLADAVVWSSPALAHPEFDWGNAVTHADVNGDGAEEVLAFPSELLAWDAKAGALLWSSAGLPNGVDVEAADLDGDGTPELVAATRDVVKVLSWDGAAYVETASRAIASVADLAVGDCDGDGAAEVYVLAGGDGSTYDPVATVHRLGPALEPLGVHTHALGVTSLFVEDLAAAPRNLVLFVRDDPPGYGQYLVAVDPESGEPVWRSPAFPGTIAPNSLRYLDVDGDGDRELAFATSKGMFVTR